MLHAFLDLSFVDFSLLVGDLGPVALQNLNTDVVIAGGTVFCGVFMDSEGDGLTHLNSGLSLFFVRVYRFALFADCIVSHPCYNSE